MKTIKTLLFGSLFLSLMFISSEEVKAQASTESGQTAIGVMIGEPTGLSLKYWKSDKNAFDLGLAWSFSGNEDAISVHGDYLWHSWLNVDKGRLAFYYGIGARVRLSNDTGVGARIPLGLNYLFAEAPLDAFIEIVPTLDVIPDTGFDGSGGIGIRYYF